MLNPEISSRVNLIIDNELLAMIDAEGKKLGMNRSAVVRFCCRQYFQSQKTLQSFTDMIDAYKAQQMQNVIDNAVPPLRNPKK